MKGTDLQRLIGITYRQFDFWCRAGYITFEQAGHGDRWFSEDQVVKAKSMALLGEMGLRPGDAVRVFESATRSTRGWYTYQILDEHENVLLKLTWKPS